MVGVTAMSGQAAPSTLSQIDELLRDAKLVHDYCNAVGEICVEDLATAINAVEALGGGARVPSATAVVELRKQYALARKKLDFDVFYSLRNGWTMFPTRGERWMTAGVVLLAILFMICVLHLTRIYNRGVELSAELTVLEASQAEKRYGELERKLLDADARLFAANLAGASASPTGCAGGDPAKAAECNKQAETARAAADEQYLLAREASHLMVFELVNLDQRIKDVNVRMREFLEQARYPINGMQTLEYSAWKFQATAWSSLTSWIGCVAGPTATDGGCVLTVPKDKQQNPVVQDTPYDPRLAGMREAFCQKVNLLEDYVAGRLDKKGLASADPFLGKVIYNISDNFGVNTARAIRQNCALGLSYYSGAAPRGSGILFGFWGGASDAWCASAPSAPFSARRASERRDCDRSLREIFASLGRSGTPASASRRSAPVHCRELRHSSSELPSRARSWCRASGRAGRSDVLAARSRRGRALGRADGVPRFAASGGRRHRVATRRPLRYLIRRPFRTSKRSI